MFTMRHALMVALAAGVVACGGAADDPDPGVKTSIGSEGGTVSHPDGVTLVIPRDALTEETSITIVRGATSLAGTRMYLFQPPGLTFDADAVVTVSFPFDPGAVGTTNASVYWTELGTEEYQALPATVVGSTASARVTHFSWGHVGEPCATNAACQPANTCKVGGLSACTDGAPTCIDMDANVEDGTECATGVCSAGACVAACHALSLTGTSPVQLTFGGATAPPATGGTIAAGTYFGTMLNSYGTEPTSSQPFQGVWVVSGNTVQGAYDAAGGVTDRWSASVSFPTSTSLSLSLTCPRTETVPYDGYTATASELKLYAACGSNVCEYVYTRQ